MAWTKAVKDEIDRNSADVDFLKDIADQDWLPEPVELLALGRGSETVRSIFATGWRVQTSTTAPTWVRRNRSCTRVT